MLLDTQEGAKAVEQFSARPSKLALYVDVPVQDDFSPYAEAAFRLGITSGFADRTLRHTSEIPVEEAVAMLMRAYDQPGEPREGDTDWFASLLRGALRKNIVPYPQSMSVGQSISREQFAQMIGRAQVVARENLAAFPEPGEALIAGAEQGISQSPRLASNRNFAISIPSLGIQDLIVTHPQDSQTSHGLLAVLQDGVGHLFSYPGRGGKIMIYGHSSGYSWDVSKYTKIFRQVNRLQPGDRVYVTFNGRLFEYAVTGQQTIAPSDATPFSGEGEELILYTCWPPNSIKQRLIVRAAPVDTVALR
jgi:LPXTG-site transpeptidase (sortase) family protein